VATQAEIAFSYDPIDALQRAALGEHADVSCAFYDGDFTLTLRQAQEKKHDLVLTRLGLSAADTLLDIGCGWGPLLQAARERGVVGTGITLSPAQVARCRRYGFDVRLQDWKDLEPSPAPAFDGIASIGAFEHFVSPAEMLAGRQDEIYRDFFRLCASLLPAGGSLFLQTMTWGKRVPRPSEANVHAPKLSDRWVLGHLAYLYPGSWLPNGLDHIAACAAPYFEVSFANNGRVDYLHTMHEWGRALDRLGWHKWRIAAPMVVRSLLDVGVRRHLRALRYACSRTCFEREIFTHFRMILTKR
jgi:cyclopropane-fatty-acyl-phospholipid synthase